MNFLVVSGASVLALVVVHGITFGIGRRIGRYNVADVAWGVGFIAVAVVAAGLGHGNAQRRWLLLGLVLIWASRLSWYIHRRSIGKGEDPRYAHLLRHGASAGQVLRKIFLSQAFATWFISLQLQLSAVTGPTPRTLLAVTAAGVALWLLGITFEAVGDRQLHVFKSDPSHHGVLMDRGLWGWTRHPNYFGDACVWWGVWLVTINGWLALVTVLSPLLMTYFLVYASGARLTEKRMEGRPGFAEYQRRTAFFVPRPPRSSTR